MGGIDFEGPDPLHAQLADLLRSRIADGTYEINRKIPSQRELEVEFGVARPTVQRALKTLVDEGLIRQVQGRGTFVVKVPEPE